MLLINEIFSSIDGEGIRTGYPVTFIRTQLCNLRCKYCDTTYSWDLKDKQGNKQYQEMTVEQILEECKRLKNKRITFTGGEPLIQPDATELVQALLNNNYEVNIETNGAVDIEKFFNSLDFGMETSHNLIFTLDYKTESSGEEEKMILENIKFLKSKDVLKFVVGSKSELDKMREIVQTFKPKSEIFISPVFGKIEPHELVEYILDKDLQNVRVQIQLHKIIWDPNRRGV